MKILFIDESGDHNLSVIDPQYPIFVLGGVIMDKAYAEEQLPNEINRFKSELFGTTDIILHTADISRNRNGFESMLDTEFRNRFYSRMNDLMTNLPYSVVACVMHKEESLGRYGLASVDPYLLCLDILVELFCFEIGDHKNGGVIVAEMRDRKLDRQLELAWQNLKINGTRRVRGSQIDDRIAGMSLRSKSDNIAGLQLADLVVSPIGRYVLGKPTKGDWEVISRKFRRNPQGHVDGYGLVVLPKERGRSPHTQ